VILDLQEFFHSEHSQGRKRLQKKATLRMSTTKMYGFHSRHDLEKVHVLQLFFTAPLIMLRLEN